jgi:Lon-like protease
VKTIKRVPVQPSDEEYAASDGTDDRDQRRARLTSGNKITLGLFFGLLALLVVGSIVKLPYAVMSPGPSVNTLGDTPGTSKPIITVEGLPTYPTDGALKFTTVRVEGGPGYPVDVWDVLQAWVDPSKDVFPVDDIFDPEVSQEQVAEENAVQMEGSQEEATAVALRALGKEVPTYVTVGGLAPTSKAKGLLVPKDRFVTVGATEITTADSLRDALQQVEPGDPVKLTVERDGKDVTVDVPTIEGPGGRTVLGITIGLTHDFPAEVTIDAGSVGGPSAGLMFSLGIYDKLTPGPLTGNRQVAGTGTIDDAGKVGAIGGIKQKLAGARAGGAEFFLAPADNCPGVVGAIPDGLEVFRVATFDEGRAAVEAIAKGRTGALPRC